MTALQTIVAPRPLEIPLLHTDAIVSLGSCFAENIATQLADYRFNICANPTGILYNPASILRILNRLKEARPFTEADLFEHNELWCSFWHHGSFAHPDKNIALKQMNAAFDRAQKQLKNGTCLFLTFGSAFAWYLKDQPDIAVANCHKLPPGTFERRLIPAHDIARLMGDEMRALKTRNPKLQVILTVSPVRHLRHYAPENSLSKAQLITACHLLSAELDFIHYFPAYEIMLDELRDYRFYADDLIHPSKVAQQIIWERFRDTCIDEKSRQFIDDYTPVLQMRNHRPLHPGTENTARFLQTLKSKTVALRQKYPDIPLPG